MEKINRDVGKLIQKAADAKGITMYQLSKDSGIGADRLSNIVNGKANITLAYLGRICHHLGVTVTITLKDK